MTMVEVIEAVAQRRRCSRVVLDDRVDHVVDGVVPPRRRRRRRSTATGPRSPAACSPRTGTGWRARRNGVAGFEVTGRWAWGSGTQHCRWVLGGTSCDDGTFRLCWVPQTDVTFHDTWYTSGMRGSGSLDYSVDAAFVPAERTIQPGVTRPVVDTPLARFPNFALLAAGVSAVGLGIARRALDEVIDLAQGKKPQYSSRTLAQSGFTQVEVARADARLRAARAFLLEQLADAWADGRSGDDGVARGAHRYPVGRRPRRDRRGRPSPTSRSRSPAAPRSTTRACSDGPCATRTSSPSTSRPRRS